MATKKTKESIEIGVELRAIRKNLNMTQEQLSVLSGIRRWNISRYETGSAMPPAKHYKTILNLKNNPASPE